ncbi:MAG: hypothetical protein EAZ76_14690 [Nostocales cyanobacterium]|nr:MAG: hypothetical protein EAZ87_00015 [Nostocales cyanobacterium]TAF12322.1 MAG: hypothetical protein EAZ76_14690 [Nostocales cyanobacterium]
MYIKEISPKNLDSNPTLNYLTPSENQHEYITHEKVDISDLAIALTPLSFVFIWAIILLIFQKIRSNLDHKMYFSIHSLNQVPCKNCQFFANNHYLKCAVKPDIVLTEEAINCSEYCPKKNKFSSNKFFS